MDFFFYSVLLYQMSGNAIFKLLILKPYYFFQIQVEDY
jgi:hypothetical protein